MSLDNPLVEASDPATSAARLSELAAAHPGTHIAIAMHPASYPALLDWLSQYGSDDVRAVVARRTGAAFVPSAPVAPVYEEPVHIAQGYGTPAQPAAAFPAPADVAPLPANAQVAANKGSITKVVLLASGAVLLTAALVVGAVIAIPLLTQPAATPAIIGVPDYSEAPELGRWNLNGPYAEEFGQDNQLGVSASTIGQDYALVRWTIEGVEAASSTTSLVNTRTGESLWSSETSTTVLTYVSGTVESGRLLMSGLQDDGATWLAYVDAGDGTLGEYVDDVYYLGSPSSLSGDIIGATETTVGRYSVDTLEPLWTVPLDGSQPFSALSTVVVGEKVYSAIDGALRPWSAPAGQVFVDYDGRFVSQTIADEAPYIISEINEETGEAVWSRTIDQGVRINTYGGFAFTDESAGSTTMFSPENGEELWTAEGLVLEQYSLLGGSVGGLVLHSKPGDDNYAIVLDRTTGEQLYELPMSAEGFDRQFVAMTEKTLYLSDREQSELQAFSARSGELLWTVDSPSTNNYVFGAWGGRLVAFRVPITGMADSAEFPQILSID